ncbi:hypothetical protein NC652_033656 [Populus alba x Populus x berolinensis]|uniref:Uncharacterized protein n=1 Tax=Populus alba x Populus x berolinensis TaxID=444605 RepID=A0AAD6LU19_9ROSI|nr:hypothetical protein NC652_033656 [Populus alba x Populus x berolinensis]KAJ6973294.1 hypothetical protein NC653_033584 [Populus alba x Populus x berolinensis]
MEAAAAGDLVSSRIGPRTITASSSSSSSSSPAPLIPYNLPLLSALLACSLAQFLKIFTTWYKEKRWDSKRMLDSGGMPSSHSATVTALAVAVGLQEGTGSPVFAIVVVLACVVRRPLFLLWCLLAYILHIPTLVVWPDSLLFLIMFANIGFQLSSQLD